MIVRGCYWEAKRVRIALELLTEMIQAQDFAVDPVNIGLTVTL
jgi:hypothetical protein